MDPCLPRVTSPNCLAYISTARVNWKFTSFKGLDTFCGFLLRNASIQEQEDILYCNFPAQLISDAAKAILELLQQHG